MTCWVALVIPVSLSLFPNHISELLNHKKKMSRPMFKRRCNLNNTDRKDLRCLNCPKISRRDCPVDYNYVTDVLLGEINLFLMTREITHVKMKNGTRVQQVLIREKTLPCRPTCDGASPLPCGEGSTQFLMLCYIKMKQKYRGRNNPNVLYTPFTRNNLINGFDFMPGSLLNIMTTEMWEAVKPLEMLTNVEEAIFGTNGPAAVTGHLERDGPVTVGLHNADVSLGTLRGSIAQLYNCFHSGGRPGRGRDQGTFRPGSAFGVQQSMMACYAILHPNQPP